MAEGGHDGPYPPAQGADPRAFYDDLAPTYHRLYPEWDEEVRAQADVLDGVLGRLLGDGPLRLLDCAVGIGTQALGLARLGHRVIGSDISEGALRRARREAVRLRAVLPVVAADMRALPFAGQAFDAVVCVDAAAHLRSVEEAASALREMARVVRPGGAVVVTVRDYEVARRDQLPGTLPQVSRTPLGETIAFQVWDWHPDGCLYDLTHIVLASDGRGWTVTTRTATLRAFVREELLEAAATAGLVDVEWLTPAETGFFQPCLVGRARSDPQG